MTLSTSCPKPVPEPKAPKGLRKVNTARQKANEARAYGPTARQKFVTLGPCAACGSTDLCDNAHVIEHADGSTKGAGYKGSYTEIAPLCRPRLDRDGNTYEGCHAFSHRDLAGFRARYPKFNPVKAARETQKRWLVFVRTENERKA